MNGHRILAPELFQIRRPNHSDGFALRTVLAPPTRCIRLTHISSSALRLQLARLCSRKVEIQPINEHQGCGNASFGDPLEP